MVCSFEEDKICGFIQDNTTDDLDWIWNKGPTPSSRTGPSVDHTCFSEYGMLASYTGVIFMLREI